MASNIGSAATITGNPQSMMIGSFSQIPYAQFTASLAPVALVGLVLTFILIALRPLREVWEGSEKSPKKRAAERRLQREESGNVSGSAAMR
jgi:Na+/H+ antiporter NhaD/arsenite permease-like protein